MITLNKNYFNKIGTKPNALNPCILGNGTSSTEDFNVLPNCTGFTTGYFNQFIGESGCRYFGDTAAVNYYNLGIRQGLSGTTDAYATVVPGTVMVFSNGGNGHCCVVDEVIDANNLKIVESGWSGRSKYWTQNYYRSGNGWTCSWMSGYTFVGFIFPPNTPPPPPPPVENKKHKFKWVLFG